MESKNHYGIYPPYYRGISNKGSIVHRNSIDIFAMTGSATDPGDYYIDNYVGLPSEGPDKQYSDSFYDTPWMQSSAREVNAFIRFDFN